MNQVGFFYDQTRCAGCKTCQVACKDKNRLEVGTVLREVRTVCCIADLYSTM